MTQNTYTNQRDRPAGMRGLAHEDVLKSNRDKMGNYSEYVEERAVKKTKRRCYHQEASQGAFLGVDPRRGRVSHGANPGGAVHCPAAF